MTKADELAMLAQIAQGDLSLIPLLADGYEDRGDPARAAFVRWAATRRPVWSSRTRTWDWWTQHSSGSERIPRSTFDLLRGYTRDCGFFKEYPSEAAAMTALLDTWEGSR